MTSLTTFAGRVVRSYATQTPRRGGINLAERFQRSRSFIPSVDVSRLSEPAKATPQTKSAAAKLARRSEEYTTIAGVRIPKEPIPPADDECCMSGCAVCIYDLYYEQKEDYDKALATSLAQLDAKSIPISQWPPEIVQLRNSQAGNSTSPSSDRGPRSTASVTMDAFAELERNLKMKATAGS